MDGLIAISYACDFCKPFLDCGQVALDSGSAHLPLDIDRIWHLYRRLRRHPPDGTDHRLVAGVSNFRRSQNFVCRGVGPHSDSLCSSCPGLATNIRHFLRCLAPPSRRRIRRLALSWQRKSSPSPGGSPPRSATRSRTRWKRRVTCSIFSGGSQNAQRPCGTDQDGLIGAEARRRNRAEQSLALQEIEFAGSLSLSELVNSVVDLQTAQLIDHGIALQRRLRAPLPLKAYSSELRQILINLIQNAMAAIGSRGRIIVRVQLRHSVGANYGERESMGQPGYSITIADTGPGINPTHRPQLFTMFFTTKGDEGTGMGLWLVRSMVEKQGGRIRFRSRTAAETDKPGTIFNIWIPLEPAPIATAAATESLSPVAAT